MPLSLIITAIVPNEALEEFTVTPCVGDLEKIRALIAQGPLDDLVKNPTYLGGAIARLETQSLRESLEGDAALETIREISCGECRSALVTIASLAQDRQAVFLCRYEVPVKKFYRKAIAA